MRQHVSILVIAYIFLVSMGSLVLVSGKDRRSDTLFGRTRREHGKDASNQAQEEDLENPPPKYTFERRRLSGEEAAKAEATRIDPTYEPEMNLIQRIKAGTFDFFTDALPEMLESVTKDEAGLIFENFKVMKTTKAWKAFQESGDTEDEEAVASAMIKSVQEMGQIMLGARYFTKDADSVTAVTDEFPSSPNY
ncbi:hypothetical protein Naga_100591g1 [Nannochloropsis gaditana]|uniref:Uncharacterized protein n=1 Tax=Nannochloropsis gaditana TaxID=72520 RepID=W7U6J4_9STRA|nr:hypothetical protein Naga_100591g1 [Nannochloropsis gaditana]